MPKKEPLVDTEAKLDAIVEYLHRMDRRDRLRTWGGFVHALFSMIPILVLLWSVWYVYEHGDELLMKITQQAASEAAKMTQNQSQDFLEKFEGYFQGE